MTDKIVRPEMANEALELLKDNIKIEVNTEKVFTLLRYFDKVEKKFKCILRVNELNPGWTVIEKSN